MCLYPVMFGVLENKTVFLNIFSSLAFNMDFYSTK